MTQPEPRAPRTRRDVPVWRQALEGIGLVFVLSLGVALVGGALALVVSLLY